jgi:tetratricopeptide (TPR) repeat protein
LGLALRRRDKSISDTTKAVACYRKIIDLAPKRHIYLPFAAFQLGIILTSVESIGNVSEAIACHHFALEHLPPNSSNYPSFVYRLGHAYYQRANVPDDYTNALLYFQKAANAVSKEDKDYPIYVANAANVLNSRKEDGDVAMAIEKYREILQLLPGDHEDVHRYQNRLGAVLCQRSLHRDLDESIELI